MVWTARSAAEAGELVARHQGATPSSIRSGSRRREEPVSFRLLASRPGSGFPVVDTGTDEVLGVVVVRGAHTADEEAEGM